MSIHIIVDSSCDLTQKKAAELENVHVLPLTTRFGEEEYYDGVTLTHEEFFKKLIEEDTLPQTSQLTPFQYKEAFERYLGPDDTAVVITLSSKLSGCFQSAYNAIADEYEDRIALVDSENVTIGEIILIKLALEYRDQGMNAFEIAKKLDQDKKQIRLIALLDTLEYLQKGGRISNTVAFIGGLLSIKPVITVEDGAIAFKGKARGSKNGNNFLINYIKESGGIDFTKPFSLAYSGLSDHLLKKYVEDSAPLYEGYDGELPVITIGSAIGTHIGPGGIALAYMAK